MDINLSLTTMRLFFFSLFLSLGMQVFGQKITIHFKNGTTISYPTSEIDNITMEEGNQDDGYISGTWYLGYWVSGNVKLKFDGSERMTFSGLNLSWQGRQDGGDDYTIVYAEDNKSFVSTNVNNASDVSTWEILKYNPIVLVLRNGGADRYFYPSQMDALNAQLELDAPLHQETNDINMILSYANGYTNSSVTPMGTHYENKRATTENDILWLKNAANEPNKVAGLSQWLPQAVNLYPYGDPSPADVNQHTIGDCSACAVFASLAYLYPDFIKNIITNNGDGTYTVKMFDPQGKPIDVCVSNKILCDSEGIIGQVTGKNNAVTWATILEKAFIKWETCYQVDGVEGIGSEFLAPLFTGNGESYAFYPNSLYTSEHQLFITWALNQGMIAIGGFNVGGMKVGELETVTNHAFTYLLPNNANAVFAMRNPWGVTSLDGVLQIPDERTIVQTIDVRAINPGAAAPYLRQNIAPYNPPPFTAKKSDIGISKRLIQMAESNTNSNELW